MSNPPTLDRLRETLTESLPYCTGTLELPDDSFELFYGKGTSKFINLSKAANPPDALESLLTACEPAKFGRGDETVLDESYRKAGKIDTSEFMLRLDVVRSGLLSAACSSLLCGDQVKRSVTAELYKLNVYGEGAFFKAHQDTPRNSKMFGSLVVVFPAPHSGGALVLRHEGMEWTFDSGKILAGAPNRVAYVAFFSDVEHEVLPVDSGHRVTATYNLYWDDSDPRETAHPDGLNILDPQNANANHVGRELEALLNNPAFMPDGGTLGFRLRHSYPFPRVWTAEDPDPLDELPGWLKGSDAALYEAFEALGLTPLLRLSTHLDQYTPSGHCEDRTVLLDHSVQLSDMQLEGQEVEKEVMKNGGVVVGDAEHPDLGEDGHEEVSVSDRVTWVTGGGKDDVDHGTAVRGPNQFSSQYVAYGNEATLGNFYMMVCMTVRIAPTSDRTPAQIGAKGGAGSTTRAGSKGGPKLKAAARKVIRILAM